MNVLHMKYAVEVAKAGSLNKAAETLMVAQPNISRSIKELESSLGISIFDRSTRGMTLTIEGEQFIQYAQDILNRIQQVEQMYTMALPKKQVFSVCGPRASYISEAFVQFTKYLTDCPSEIYYRETNSQETIQHVLNDQTKLGIIRYSEKYDKYFKQMLEEKGLQYELVTEFSYQLVMSSQHILAKKEEIQLSDLKDCIEILHGDPYILPHPSERGGKEELLSNTKRKIYIYERASQFVLLSENRETFMWCSFVPDHYLERYQLIQRPCAEQRTVYKDVLIYKNKHRLTPLDQTFITELCAARRKYQ